MMRRGLKSVDIAGWFVLATIPTTLFGLWNAGRVLRADVATTSQSLVQAVSIDLVTGAALFLPVLLVASLASLFWGLVFAVMRKGVLDSAWLMSAWLFVLLLPPGVPLLGVFTGVSFGVIFGQHVFGGSGKYLVSPALLGVLFLRLAYPGWFDERSWLAGSGDWQRVFIGLEPGLFGTTSELLCLLGAALLVFRGIVSWRVLAGGFAGAVATALLLDASMAWYGHLLLGQFVFCVAFVATDPSVGAASRPGRWLYGGLIGALTVLIRVVDPAHPEATLLACLTAALFAPLIDTIVVRVQVFRYQRRAVT